MSDRADKLKTITKLSTTTSGKYLQILLFIDEMKIFIRTEKSASKIQAAFRTHQARLKLKNQAAWQIHEKLEYSSEQTEAKVMNISDHVRFMRIFLLVERSIR